MNKIQSERTWKGRQSFELERILETPAGHKVRIRIDRDTYDFQSHATAEVWSPTDLRWNEVHTLPAAEVAAFIESPYAKREDLEAEISDLADEIEIAAMAILDEPAPHEDSPAQAAR